MSLPCASAHECPQVPHAWLLWVSKTRRGKGPLDVPGDRNPGGGVTLARDDVPFNICDAPALGLYEVFVHEGGHALGIRDASSVAPGWDGDIVLHHPSVYESMMSYESPYEPRPGDSSSILPDDPDCSPHPLDVLAIYALYQQESSP